MISSISLSIGSPWNTMLTSNMLDLSYIGSVISEPLTNADDWKDAIPFKPFGHK